VGGFFMEDNFSAKTNMFLLSAGMILAIPTTIAMLSATQYEPPANYVQDQAPSDEPVADPPGAGASLEQKQKQKSHKQQQKRRVAVRRTSPVAPALYSQLPPALVGLTEGGFDLSVPALALYQMYSPRQMAEFRGEAANRAADARVQRRILSPSSSAHLSSSADLSSSAPDSPSARVALGSGPLTLARGVGTPT
jgi:hypothetical protein